MKAPGTGLTGSGSRIYPEIRNSTEGNQKRCRNVFFSHCPADHAANAGDQRIDRGPRQANRNHVLPNRLQNPGTDLSDREGPCSPVQESQGSPDRVDFRGRLAVLHIPAFGVFQI